MFENELVGFKIPGETSRSSEISQSLSTYHRSQISSAISLSLKALFKAINPFTILMKTIDFLRTMSVYAEIHDFTKDFKVFMDPLEPIHGPQEEPKMLY